MDKKRLAAILFGLTLLCSAVVSGENLLKNGDAESGELNWAGTKISSDKAKTGKNCFELPALADQSAFSEELIPVEGMNQYEFSGFVKNCGKSVCRILVGLIPYDKNKQPIQSYEVNIVPGTETVLAKACKPGDKTLKVKDAGKWKADPNSLVVFNADDSGNYADLPNRFKTSPGINSIINKNGVWEVTLSESCGKDFPAGTKIREHAVYNTYIYPIILDINPESGWKKISSTIDGTAKFGSAEEQFWAGTAFVRILIIKPSSNKLLFDDFSFENMPVKNSPAGQGSAGDVLNGGFENWTVMDNVPVNWDVAGKLIPEKWGIENRPDENGKICRIVNSPDDGSDASFGKYSMLLNGRLVSQHIYDKVKNKKIKVSLTARGHDGNIIVRLREYIGKGEDMYVMHLMEIINTSTTDKWCQYTGIADMPGGDHAAPTAVSLEIIGKNVAIDNVQAELSDINQQSSVILPIIYNLPVIPDKVVIDGNFSEQEWNGAAGMNTGFMALGGNLLKRQSEYYLSADNKNLLICLRTPFTKALKQQTGNRDGNIWEDDTCEIHINPIPGQKNPQAYQFVINALGTVYDARSDMGANWNCEGLKIASKCNNNIWTLEVAIPLAEVGLQPGKEFGFNLCRNLKDPGGFSNLNGQGYFDYDKMLLLRINKDSPAIFWGSNRAIGDGNLDLFARVSNKGVKTQDCEISFTVSAEQVAKKETRKLTLPPMAQETVYFNTGKVPGGFGEIALNAQNSADKTAIAAHKIIFDPAMFVTQETGNKIAFYPVQNKIGVILTDAQLGRAAKVEVTISRNDIQIKKASTDKIEISVDKKGQAMVNFTPPEEGTYLVSAVVLDKADNCLGYVANDVVVQKPAWLNNDGGKEMICRPFIPLAKNGRTLSCWGRQYTFAGSGLPEQIISQKENVLASPIAFAWTDGAKAVYGKPGEFKITGFSDQSATFTGETLFNSFKIVTHGRLEYNGTIFYDIDIVPQGQASIPNLHLEIPFSNMKYFHTQNLWMSNHPEKGEYIDSTVPVWTPEYNYNPVVRTHNSLYFPEKDGTIWSSRVQNDFIPYLTFGNTLYGLCWFADNDRGWSRDLKKPSYEIIRTGVSSKVQINLISKLLKTAAVDRISFALAATPVRPRKTGFNYLTWKWIIGFGANSFTDRALAGLGVKDSFLVDKYLAAADPNGECPFLFYIAKAYFSLGDPAARYFYNEWHTIPEASYSTSCWMPMKKYGLNPDNYFAPAGCMYPERVDYIASQIDALIKKTPRLRGFYWDENYSVPCRDIFHRNCGFRLEDGSIQASVHYFGMHELDKRAQTILQKYNRPFPNMLDHCTDMIPPLYSFADINLCAERGTKNLDFIDYWDLPRIENTGAGAWGLNIMWTPQWEQAATQGGPNTLANNRSMLAALKLFDFNIWELWCLPELLAKFRATENKFGIAEDDSKFFGYWQKENKQAVSGMPVFVKSSFFVRPGKGALVYVSNLNKARQKVQLQLDFSKWNINNFKITDTENGQEIKHNGKSVALDVEGHDFRNMLIEQVR